MVPPPNDIENLSEIAYLRIACRRLRVEKIECTQKNIHVEFREKTPVSPEQITNLLLKSKGQLRFDPPATLKIVNHPGNKRNMAYRVRSILNELG